MGGRNICQVAIARSCATPGPTRKSESRGRSRGQRNGLATFKICETRLAAHNALGLALHQSAPGTIERNRHCIADKIKRGAHIPTRSYGNDAGADAAALLAPATESGSLRDHRGQSYVRTSVELRGTAGSVASTIDTARRAV